MPPKTPRKSERPVFWIIAGPNGSGKSSLYNETSIEGWGGSVWIINPDLLTSTISETEALFGADANLAAVQRIETWLETSIDVYQTIGVETVLSSGKYRRLLGLAHGRGFEVRMIFVALRSADEQLQRIKVRVAEGGHDVPEAKVRARRTRSFEQLAWFATHVDQLFLFDNSGAQPALMATGSGGSPLVWHRTPGSSLRAELVTAGLGDGLPPLVTRKRPTKATAPPKPARNRRRGRKRPSGGNG
jgi:predicted ABC-type ATPase